MDLLKMSLDDTGGRIRQNWENERFLSADGIRQLKEAVLSASETRWKEAYVAECRRHLRSGGHVRCAPLPVLLGRAVEKDNFRKALLKHGSPFWDERCVDRFLQELLDGKEIDSSEAHVPMSGDPAWTTWDWDSGTNDPFQFAVNADHVRASLGLDPRYWQKDKPLLLFTYTLPDGIRLLRPTVADAGTHWYFQPPPPEFNECGITMVAHTVGETVAPVRCKEAVHEPVALRCLKRRREIR